MKLKEDISWRLGAIYLGIAIATLFILVKIFYLQFWENEKWESQAKELQFKYVKSNPDRGDICATDGRILATSMAFYEIRIDLGSISLADTTFTNNIEALSDSLANLFKDKTKEEYLEGFRKARINKSKYHLVKKNVNYGNLKMN